MKNYRLKEEHPGHFVLHDTKDKQDFIVAKAHLDPSMLKKMEKIQKFDDGGEVDTGTGEAPAAPTSAPTNTTDTNANVAEASAVPAQDLAQNTPPAAPSVGTAPAAPTAPPPGMSADDYEQIMSEGGKKQLEALGQEQGANTAIGAAQANAANATSLIQTESARALKEAADHTQAALAQNNAEYQSLYSQVKSGQIDPQRYWNNQSVGSKVGMLAGMIISGFGAGAGQGNMAVDILNRNIDADIDSQKTNLGKQKGLLSENVQRFGTLNAGLAATRLNLLSIAQGQIDAAAAKSGSPIAQANAQKANAQISQQAAQLQQQLSIQQAGYKMLNRPTGQQSPNGTPLSGGFDLNRYYGLKMLGMISPEDDKAIQSEMGNYEEMKNKVNYASNNMQAIADEQTLAKRLGHPLKSYADIKDRAELTAATTARDINGRVNEQIYNAMLGAMPSLANPDLAPEKIANVAEAIKKGYQFTRSQRFGLLNQNDPAVMTPAQRQALVEANKINPNANRALAGTP